MARREKRGWRHWHARRLAGWRRKARHLGEIYWTPGSPAEMARWLRAAHRGVTRFLEETTSC